jgi:EAL domain-containing protein (putative c-di-GMP-specific phosphodiesterase class I)
VQQVRGATLSEDKAAILEAPQLDLIGVIEDLGSKQDLLLVKLLVTNGTVIEDEFGLALAKKAFDQLAIALERLTTFAQLKRMSNMLFAFVATDTSNPVGFVRQVKTVVSEFNATRQYRFLLEMSIGAVVTDHTSKLEGKAWLTRLNLAVMKSTRTGQTEIADKQVATSERVRQELSRIGPGSSPPKGMYWVYQPINYIADGKIFGYEVLCRWDSPTLGSVSPDLFIPVAEDLNLVQIIDFWTLKAVEAAYPELIRRGAQAISINVSALTLGNPNEFFAAVDHLLPQLKDAHFAMIVEMTETSVIQNQIDLSMGLLGLRKRGAKIAIDDWGTGKTSLSVTSSLPSDFVKLDGSLLQVERPDLSLGLLELGVKFADLVGAEVIVEKVETQADLDLARQVGAKFAQGWLFGQPLDLRPAKSKPKKSPKK